MASSRYVELLPYMLEWIQQTLNAYAGEKTVVGSIRFPRLSNYFSKELLDSASVVVTDRLPAPPLSALGLGEFADFERQPMGGITYQDTYFIETSAAANESLHFHELVHVIQWRVLGQEDFLLKYAAGLAEHGYLDCPLERMAYEHQRRFDAGHPPYPVEAAVGAETLALKNLD